MSPRFQKSLNTRTVIVHEPILKNFARLEAEMKSQSHEAGLRSRSEDRYLKATNMVGLDNMSSRDMLEIQVADLIEQIAPGSGLKSAEAEETIRYLERKIKTLPSRTGTSVSVPYYQSNIALIQMQSHMTQKIFSGERQEQLCPFPSHDLNQMQSTNLPSLSQTTSKCLEMLR